MKQEWVTKMCVEAHEVASSKGFWEDPPSVYRSTLLMIGEVSELYEAIRKGKENDPCDKEGLDLTNAEEELADIAIRIFDYWGGRERPLRINEYFAVETCGGEDLDRMLLYMVRHISLLSLRNELEDAFYYVRICAYLLDIDLVRAVELKHAYNKGRPYKHGKQF